MLNPLAFVSNIIATGTSTKANAGNTSPVNQHDNSGFKNALNQFLGNAGKAETPNTEKTSTTSSEAKTPQEGSITNQTEEKEFATQPSKKAEVTEENKAVSPEVAELSKQLNLTDTQTPKFETLTTKETPTVDNSTVKDTDGEQADVKKAELNTEVKPEIQIPDPIKVPDFIPQPITVDQHTSNETHTLTETPVNESADTEDATMLGQEISTLGQNANVQSSSQSTTTTSSNEKTVKGSEFQQPAWLNQNEAPHAAVVKNNIPYEQKVVQRKPLSLNAVTPKERPLAVTSQEALNTEVLLNDTNEQPLTESASLKEVISLDGVSNAKKTETTETTEFKNAGLEKVAEKQLPSQASETANQNSRLTGNNEQVSNAIQNGDGAEVAIENSGKKADVNEKTEFPKLSTPPSGKEIEPLSNGEVLPKDAELKTANTTNNKIDIQGNNNSAVQNAGSINLQSVLNKNPHIDSVQVAISNTQNNTSTEDTSDVSFESTFENVLDAGSETSQTSETNSRPQISSLNTGVQFTGTHNSSQVTGTSGQALLAPQAEQVGGAMIDQLQSGKKEVTLNMTPEELGPVRIRITQTGDQQISTRMVVATQEARDLLEGQINQLKTKMDGHGVNLEKVTIVVAGSAETASEFNNSKGQFGETNQQQQNQQQNTNHNQQQANQENLWAQFNQNNGQHNGQQAQTNTNNTNSNTVASDTVENIETEMPTTHLENYNESGKVSVLA